MDKLENKESTLSIKEQHLFIIWEHARHKEKDILQEIKAEFKILKEIEIEWDKDKFFDNLTCFYGFEHHYRYFVDNIRGNGKFLIVIVEDKNPEYIDVQTSKGLCSVNKNTFNIKQKVRTCFFDGKYVFHSTNTVAETKHDICILTGKSLDDLNKQGFFDGKRINIKRNTPAVQGWKNIEQVFYVLNETVNYVVIRDCEIVPNMPQVDSAKGFDYADIEILTDDIQALKYTLLSRSENEFDCNIFVNVGDKIYYFHSKFLGDRYFDINIEKKLLETKTKNQNGIWVVGDKELYFYTLIYHSIIHKCNYQKYDKLFTSLAKDINVEYRCDLTILKNLLHKWMDKYKYKYKYKRLDVHHTFHVENIIAHKMIDKEPTIFCFKNGHNTVIFTSELIIKDPLFASYCLKDVGIYFQFHKNILNSDDKLYKEISSRPKNELGWIYEKRFGRIVKTTIFFNKRIKIKKEILGFPKMVENRFLSIKLTNKSEPVKGENVGYLIKNQKTKASIITAFEYFICEAFRQYEHPNNSNILNSAAWNALPYNCRLNQDSEYKFFISDYVFKGNLEKSYFLWRVLFHTPVDGVDKETLYEYFCKKYVLANKYEYFKYFDYIVQKDLYFDSFPCDLKVGLPSNQYLYKKILQLLATIIPFKQLRKKFREKIKHHFGFPNRKIFKRYFY